MRNQVAHGRRACHKRSATTAGATRERGSRHRGSNKPYTERYGRRARGAWPLPDDVNPGWTISKLDAVPAHAIRGSCDGIKYVLNMYYSCDGIRATKPSLPPSLPLRERKHARGNLVRGLNKGLRCVCAKAQTYSWVWPSSGVSNFFSVVVREHPVRRVAP